MIEFLDKDGLLTLWGRIKAALQGKADVGHTHNYSELQDAPPAGSGASVTIDDAISATSENPVQNKVIKAALDGKADIDTDKLAKALIAYEIWGATYNPDRDFQAALWVGDRKNDVVFVPYTTNNRTDMRYHFKYMANLVAFAGNFPNVLRLDQSFMGCTSLREVYIDGMTSATNLSQMFQDCVNLKTVRINTSSVTTINNIFSHAESLSSVTFVGGTQNVMYTNYAFVYCRELTSIALDLSSAKETYLLFTDCGALTDMRIDNYGNLEPTQNMTFPVPAAVSHDSLIYSFLDHSKDRAAEGWQSLTIRMNAATKARLSDEEKAAIVAKGYIIA